MRFSVSRQVANFQIVALRRRYLDLGPIFGPILCIITAVQGIFLGILDWLQPRAEIDLVPLPASWTRDIQLKS
jgi:hypothetical protein